MFSRQTIRHGAEFGTDSARGLKRRHTATRWIPAKVGCLPRQLASNVQAPYRDDVGIVLAPTSQIRQALQERTI
jgi:hypothetical protein